MKKIILGLFILLTGVLLVGCNKDLKVTLSKQSITLFEGQEETITATVSIKDKTVTWSSSSTEVATVDNGKIKAIKKGIATITAKVDDVEATCSVRVLEEGEVIGDKEPNYNVDLETLNLGGKEIKYFTHVADEDNPFSDGYSETDKAEYQKFLTDLQAKYNFTLTFTGWTDYENRIEDVALHVLSNVGSAIVRSPELDFVINMLSSNYLHNITGAANALKEDYAINDWQVQAGTIQNSVFGIQNKDGVEYVEMLVYNKTLLSEAGITKLPAELWTEGNWTFSEMESQLRKIQQANVGNNVYPLAITPYHVAMYAPAANGTKLVLEDGTLNLLGRDTLTVLNDYKDWYDYKYIRPLEFPENDQVILKHSLATTWESQKAAFGVAMMWQLEGIAKSASFEYGVVPFPQFDDKAKSDYYTPLSPGDLQLVTAGNNADEVATILFLLNEFQKDKRENELKDLMESNPGKTEVEVKAISNVSKYLKLTNETEIEQAREIFSFLQGTLSFESIKSNDLGYLNGELEYVKAVQNYFEKGGSARTYIEAIVPKINENINRMLSAIEKSKENWV